MPNSSASELDFKALARTIRAHGITAGKESSQLLEEGELERAEALGHAADELNCAAERLEAWRRHQGEELRSMGLAVATQRVALNEFEQRDGPDMRPREKVQFHKAANITDGVAEALGSIVQQLDYRKPGQQDLHFVSRDESP